MIELPIAWLLSAIGILAGTIATLAGVLWGFTKSRLEAQDKIIEAQTQTIAKLQADVDRVSKGCGHKECLWRGRE